MNFYEVINMLYTKKKIKISPDTSLNLTLSKWLSWDKSNLTALKSILKYQFTVSPKHFFYMLYFAIPKKFKAPYLKKIGKIEEKEDKLLEKVQYVLEYSKANMRKTNTVINLIVGQNSSYWKKELGVK